MLTRSQKEQPNSEGLDNRGKPPETKEERAERLQEKRKWRSAHWTIPSAFNSKYVRYKCPFCDQKSVYIDFDAYSGNLVDPTKPLENAVQFGEDNRFYHRDNYVIPSIRRGRTAKLTGKKRLEMRKHHNEKHSEHGMPVAYREIDTAQVALPVDPEDRRKEKNSRDTVKRKARAQRKQEGTSTEDDRAYYYRRAQASKRHRQAAKDKAAEARARRGDF